MVFGVVFMLVGGVTGIVAPGGPLNWRAGAAALFGLGAALVLDEVALILHLRDVYWTSDRRLRGRGFVAAGVTVLLLLGFVPKVVPSPTTGTGMPGRRSSPSRSASWSPSAWPRSALKGKIWKDLFGVFLFPLLIVGSIRLARPGSPWARWRYQRRPHKRARAAAGNGGSGSRSCGSRPGRGHLSG